MAGDEVGVREQVRALYGIAAEAEVRLRHGARFLRVVVEVALGEIVRLFADDLDGVLVRPDRAVGAESVEQGAVSLVGKAEGIVQLQARCRSRRR